MSSIELVELSVPPASLNTSPEDELRMLSAELPPPQGKEGTRRCLLAI